MAEWSVLFMGPVGSGKSTAIRTLSDIEVVHTEARATDATRHIKATTTVSMDVGVLNLDGTDKLRLYGAPGQDRFDFMWDVLLDQAKAAIVLVNHTAPHPEQDLAYYIRNVAERLGNRQLPLVVGVTHVDQRPDRPLSIYNDCLMLPQSPFFNHTVPLFQVDARDRAQVRALALEATALLQKQGRQAPAGG